MKSRLLAAAALGASLVAGFAFAQDKMTTQSTALADANAAAYLKADNIQDFYTSANLKTMKSADEVKHVYEAMTADDQARMKAACAANQENRFADLCKNIGSL